MNKLIMVLFTSLTLLVPVAAQRTLYAPDLADSETRRAWLGLANHSADTVLVTITGYDAAGEMLGTTEVELASRARFEASGESLFPGLAWAVIEAPIALSGYSRFAGQTGMSLAPLARVAGPDLYLPGVSDNGEGAKVVVVNTSEAEGTVTSKPFRTPPYDLNAAHLEEPVVLGTIGGPHSRLEAGYADLVTGVKQGLRWDRLRADIPLVGAQHFEAEGGSDFGSLTPMLTPQQEWIIAPLAPAESGYKTHFVLANTTQQLLRVRLTIRDALIPEPVVEELELEAGEKRTYTLGDPTQLPQFKPIWCHIKANENGLAAYQYTTANQGGALAYSEARAESGTRVSLPYVRNDSSHETRVTLINTSSRNARYHVSGFDAAGTQVAFWRSGNVAEGVALTHDLADLFGDNAAEVDWLEVRAVSGQVALLSLVYARDRANMAAMSGTPVLFTRDVRPIAGYEFQQALDLDPQGWQGKRFADDFARPLFDSSSSYLQEHCDTLHDGMFFTEGNFIASQGLYYLGYEPRYSSKRSGYPTQQEEIALVSPFFEVPDYAACFISFDLRLINPEWSTSGSRYGLVWRVEGSEDWQWFGLTGDILQNPPTLIADCWERVCYRDNHNEVTLTPWFAFQAPLSESVAGKRIQLGLFYNHIHTRNSPPRGPTLFIDNVAVSATPTQHALFYETAAGPVAQQEVQAEEEE